MSIVNINIVVKYFNRSLKIETLVVCYATSPRYSLFVRVNSFGCLQYEYPI